MTKQYTKDHTISGNTIIANLRLNHTDLKTVTGELFDEVIDLKGLTIAKDVFATNGWDTEKIIADVDFGNLRIYKKDKKLIAEIDIADKKLLKEMEKDTSYVAISFNEAKATCKKVKGKMTRYVTKATLCGVGLITNETPSTNQVRKKQLL